MIFNSRLLNARPLLLYSLALSLWSCGLISRHPQSGYFGTGMGNDTPSQAKDFYQQRQIQRETEAREELGYSLHSELSEGDQLKLNQRLTLKKWEESIPTQKEKNHYYHYKGLLPNDLARITFLQIPTLEQREAWANKVNLIEDEKEGYTEEMAKIIENNDIVIGMTQNAVTESWGDPDIKEVAGNHIYHNECWKYSKFVPSEEGYRREVRHIYFESGKVVGWEIN